MTSRVLVHIGTRQPWRGERGSRRLLGADEDLVRQVGIVGQCCQ